MKRILITGKDSYIGASFQQWIKGRFPDNYVVDMVGVRDGAWKDKSFAEYDAVYHLAGLVHLKETKHNKEQFFQINRDKAYQVALKAKRDGVKQFVFLSTMSVYGINTGFIDKETPIQPKSAYGRSKFEAEEQINQLSSSSFKVVVIRPPMVYGKGCKGNYPRLARLAKITCLFPKCNNKRSMIYIDNLSMFVKLLIDDGVSGLFFPQNAEYVNTSEMVRLIAQANGRRMRLVRFLNPLIRILDITVFNKIFGDLTCDMKLSEYDKDYHVCSFEESILLTEKG